MQLTMTCSTIIVPEAKKKKEDWSLRSVEYAVQFGHTSTFLFVSRHNAMLSQCCCLIAFTVPRAEVPGEEIDPIVVIEGEEKKRKDKKEQIKQREE